MTLRSDRNRYVVTFECARGVDGVRALRWLLKIAGRRLGLIVDAYEDASASLEISNKVADDRTGSADHA
jgi:hypothetical protein